MRVASSRSGRFVKTADGAEAFIPDPIPPLDRIDLNGEVLEALSEAQMDIGRLDGASTLLPDPDLFVMMYVKKEAVLSSQIEGTQASLIDVLEFEANVLDPEGPRDVKEVVNYIGAMSFGIEKIREGKLIDLEMIRDLHKILMKGSRGGDLKPGHFREVQNWIGPGGCTIRDAVFVPPPPEEMIEALGELESYLRERDESPSLIRSALIHSQFESIHPFLDGNGRMGRLLITLNLIREGVLARPLLYLSHYLLRNRSRYYDHLQNLREGGDYESWIIFFLKGISEVSRESYDRTMRIRDLKDKGKNVIIDGMGRNSQKALILHEELFRRPIVNVNNIAEITGLTYQSANKLVNELERLGILVEVTGGKRNRVYEFREYMDVLNE